MAAKTFAEITKFNPYHDSKGRFASANSAASFTYAPGKSTAHDKAIQRGKEEAGTAKGFKGTLYHGSPSGDIEEFDIGRAGSNTSSGEKLIYLTDSKQMAEDFSYERLDGDTMFTQKRGKKGRVYEVDVEMKNPLDFRNLTDKDVENILQLDADGLLTPDLVRSLSANHQLLKASLTLNAESLKKLGYDGLIANTGKAGHTSLEYAVVDSKQAKIRKAASPMTFDDVLKFNPYHDARGRFASANTAASFTIRTKDPSQQHLADRAIAREKERAAAGDEPSTDTPRMQAIHSIEDRIRDQFYESAAIVDKDGNVLLYKDGGASEVGFSSAEIAMMKDNTLTHNHPRSSIFSVEDTYMFMRSDMEEMRATTREGTTYSIKRGEGYTSDKGQRFVIDYDGEMKSARRVAQNDLDHRGFREKIWAGEITQQEANKEFGKVMSREMENWGTKNASKYGIDFSVEKRDVSPRYNVSTSKAADDGEHEIILDQETNAQDDAAFNAWLNGDQLKKSPKDGNAVLFIGLKITGVSSLAIEGGEDPEEFHVTLAYGQFDRGGHDEKYVDGMVEEAIDKIRDLIPDTIHFDAIGRFSASGTSNGKDVIYAQVAAGQLEKAHNSLLKSLKERGIKLEDTFPTYKPHMTLAYIEPDQEYELSKIDASGTADSIMIGHGRESSHENEYTVMKTDDDKRLVFGWASVSIKVDGEQLEDRQQDLIDPEDLEEAAYEYVLNFRDAGERHNPNLRKKGKLVESCVFTAEKQKAMGIPEGIVPIGWWIGFYIEDDEAWEKVKSGVYKMFSIEGKAQRVPVTKAAPAVSENAADRFDYIIEEFP